MESNKWSQNEIQKFIRLVRVQSGLWDNTNPDYGKTSKRQKSFEEIAEATERRTVADCKLKWKRLRTYDWQIVNYRKRTSWEPFGSMSFLKPTQVVVSFLYIILNFNI